MFSMNLMSCNNQHEAFFKGQCLYIDNEKYIPSVGVYEETNTVLCKMKNDYTIYEVDGDTGHNYVVVRSFLDEQLYVKENYTKDKTAIDGIYIGQSEKKYISDKEFIDIFEVMMASDEKVEIKNECLASYRKDGIDISIKYHNDCVGEYCGSILYDGVRYIYYNHLEEKTILINEELISKLETFIVLK